jgi:hypothetical protein
MYILHHKVLMLQDSEHSGGRFAGLLHSISSRGARRLLRDGYYVRAFLDYYPPLKIYANRGSGPLQDVRFELDFPRLEYYLRYFKSPGQLILCRPNPALRCLTSASVPSSTPLS